MHIQTLNFGAMEVSEENIISFKEGLPGFPQIRRFALLDFEDLKPFQYLQALDDPPIALLVINPFLVDPQYHFDLPESDMAEIECSDTRVAEVFVVATIPENPEDATLNFMAPIVINQNVRRGKQVILHDSNYSIKHPLGDPSHKSE
jgi:flagellar assembly factor FliW